MKMLEPDRATNVLRERERDERVCGREREGGRVATPTLESQTGFSYTMKYISVQS